MKLTKTRQTWLEHVKQCEASKVRMSDYAKQHGLNVRQFYQIESTFRKEGLLEAITDSPKAPPMFTQVMMDNIAVSAQQTPSCKFTFQGKSVSICVWEFMFGNRVNT